MKFPKNMPKAAMELKIPDLAGGLNLRDGLSEVLDNQLTDCKNMWFHDGLLKTRPGMRATENTVMSIGRAVEQTVKIRNFPEIKYIELKKLYYLRVTEVVQDITYNGDYFTSLQFAWQSDDKTIPLKSISVNGKDINYFVCCKKDLLYCFTSDFKIHTLDMTNTLNEWDEVKEKDIYTPLVMTHCKTLWGFNHTAEELVGAGGTMFEGFNLLGNRYRMKYSTMNKNIMLQTSDVDKTKRHQMRYSLLYIPPEGSTVTAILTDTKGEKHEHTVIIGSNQIGREENEPGDGYKLHVSAPVKSVSFLNADTNEVAYVTENDNYIEDNLEIIASCPNDDKYLKKVFGMTRCEWFGGAATGIAGGTRLFLCGNNGDNKALVLWSGLNDPLYFSENSYFYVGDTTSAVKGFGKQSDKLVIFKENETWYTYYQQNTDINAQNLIDQSIVDYTASSVYFPLCQINANIGCRYPETIQLCRNRLVWLGDNGNVYTLVSENQYNERSIFCVSEMVKKSLKKHSIISPSSCDWNGYYCLYINDNLYLMDYNSYGYTHIASFSKTEDANVRIPWYIWEFPVSGSLCSLDDKMILTYYHDGITHERCAVIGNVLAAGNESVDSICYEDDSERYLLFKKVNIVSKATTKLFDFGKPNIRKNVDKINLQLGNNGGEAINVRVITECGEESQEIVLTGAETQSYTPGFIDSKAIFPCIRQIRKIGLELSSTGVIAVDGMNLKYRTTGGAR